MSVTHSCRPGARGGGSAGSAAGVVGLFSIFFFPQLAIALWLLVAGAALAAGRLGRYDGPGGPAEQFRAAA